jgi:ribosomal protein S18 acetylase RimI-like enzyme
MPALRIEPFADEHLEASAALLADRHRRHRAVEPRLPADLDLRAEIEDLRARGGAGAVGIRDGRVVAYLVGTRLSDEMWGPNVWVELAGHAAERAEDIRDLYGSVAGGWVDEGRRGHFLYLPASDGELIDAWFRLEFGAQHAFGIRELADEPVAEITGVVVREAEERDIDAIMAVGPSLGEHQSRSPVFARDLTDPPDELRAEILGDLADPKHGLLVAELERRIVGAFDIVPIEYSGAHVGLARFPGVAHLGYAAVLPEARGSGAGLALTAASFAWARERGYDAMVTDWRVTNLLSSRFWPNRGFRTTFLRLHRHIG